MLRACITTIVQLVTLRYQLIAPTTHQMQWLELAFLSPRPMPPSMRVAALLREQDGSSALRSSETGLKRRAGKRNKTSLPPAQVLSFTVSEIQTVKATSD